MGSTWLKKICIWGGLSLGVLPFLLLLLDDTPFELMKHLLCGGFAHLWASLPYMVPKLPSLMGFAILLLVSVCGLHALLTKFAKSKHGPEARWRPKWTLALVALLLVALGTASASIGLTHHAAWLGREGVIYFDDGRGTITKSVSNCRQMVLALKLYASDHRGQYPKRLEDLAEDETVDRESLVKINRMISRDGLEVPLVFLAGVTDAAPGDIPLVIGSCSVGRNRYLLGLNDGGASAVTKEEFEEAMARYRDYVGASAR